MSNEYDYDQQAMKEAVTVIEVPRLSVPVSSCQSSARQSGGLFMDLQKLLEQQRQRQEKRIQILKQKQHTIGQQVNKRLADKDRKIRQLEQEQKRKVYAECTFKPKTTKKGNTRSFEQFLHNQEQFTKKIQQKRSSLKQKYDAQKESKNTFKPKTNIKGQEHRKTAPVHERLYALRDKENDDQGNSQVSSVGFHPQITQKSKRLARNGPINELLYQDALRRQEKAKNIESMSHQTLPNPGKEVNLNNEKYVAQKFIKQYYGVIQKLSVPSSTHIKIEYMLFNEILKEMGFVQVDQQTQNSHERALIHDAYELLEGYQVNAKNICVFLLALVGVFHINPVNFQEGQEQIPEQQLAFDESEGRKIQKVFDLFKRNRLFSDNLRKQTLNETPSFSFKPTTNKASDKMAEAYREQMLQEVNQVLEMYPQIDFNVPKDGVISPTDLLVLYNKAKEIKHLNRKEELDQEELDQCTFKPTTLPESQAMVSSKFSTGQGSIGQKKSLQLYNFHRQLQNKKQSLRVSRQSEDPTLKECTFAPNTTKHKIQSDISNYKTKEVDEALYRMRKGRQQMQEKKKFMQRGEPATINKDQKYHSGVEKYQQQSQQTPILLLDVNLGNKIERLTLYNGDEERLDIIARQFAEEYGLDSQSESKLLELLHMEVENMLQKIPQDSQSEDNNQ